MASLASRRTFKESQESQESQESREPQHRINFAPQRLDVALKYPETSYISFGHSIWQTREPCNERSHFYFLGTDNDMQNEIRIKNAVEFLKKTSSVTYAYIHVAHQCLEFGHQCSGNIVDALEKHPNLRYIVLSHQQMTENQNGIRSFLANIKVEILVITRYMFSHHETSENALIEMLISNPKLKVLSLIECQFSKAFMTKFANALRRNDSLMRLELFNSGIEYSSNEEPRQYRLEKAYGYAQILLAVATHPQLQIISIPGNTIYADYLTMFKLGSNHVLTSINLSNTGIPSAAISQMLESFNDSSSIVNLDLSKLSFTIQTFKTLSRCISTNKTIRQLSIRHLKFVHNDEDEQRISEDIACDTDIKNEIMLAMSEFAAALETNTQLEVLCMDHHFGYIAQWQQIKFRPLNLIIRSLEKNHSILRLSLDGSGIGPMEYDSFMYVLPKNNTSSTNKRLRFLSIKKHLLSKNKLESLKTCTSNIGIKLEY